MILLILWAVALVVFPLLFRKAADSWSKNEETVFAVIFTAFFGGMVVFLASLFLSLGDFTQQTTKTTYSLASLGSATVLSSDDEYTFKDSKSGELFIVPKYKVEIRTGDNKAEFFDREDNNTWTFIDQEDEWIIYVPDGAVDWQG